MTMIISRARLEVLMPVPAGECRQVGQCFFQRVGERARIVNRRFNLAT